MTNTEPMRFFEVKTYIDNEGREVDEVKCVQDGTIKYCPVAFFPSPLGLQRRRLVDKDSRNIAECLKNYDEFVAACEKKILGDMKKPKLEVASTVPPVQKGLVQ